MHTEWLAVPGRGNPVSIGSLLRAQTGKKMCVPLGCYYDREATSCPRLMPKGFSAVPIERFPTPGRQRKLAAFSHYVK